VRCGDHPLLSKAPHFENGQLSPLAALCSSCFHSPHAPSYRVAFLRSTLDCPSSSKYLKMLDWVSHVHVFGRTNLFRSKLCVVSSLTLANSFVIGTAVINTPLEGTSWTPVPALGRRARILMTLAALRAFRRPTSSRLESPSSKVQSPNGTRGHRAGGHGARETRRAWARVLVATLSVYSSIGLPITH
jgi:hypothetical protein